MASCVTAHTPLGGAAANSELFGSVSCLVWMIQFLRIWLRNTKRL
ncbi:unnamed protein product [Prunus brigantina]